MVATKSEGTFTRVGCLPILLSSWSFTVSAQNYWADFQSRLTNVLSTRQISESLDSSRIESARQPEQHKLFPDSRTYSKSNVAFFHIPKTAGSTLESALTYYSVCADLVSQSYGRQALRRPQTAEGKESFLHSIQTVVRMIFLLRALASSKS